MIKRVVLAVLGLAAVGNGTVMLLAGQRWFVSVPGVSDSGPFNPHFVADVGVAFAVGGLAFLACAWRPRYWPAALTAAGFFAGHGLIHVAGLLGGHAGHEAFQWIVVVLPAALALWAALPEKGATHA